jgi:hypothetical protein
LAIATELYVQDGKNAKERSWIVGNFWRSRIYDIVLY